MRSKELEEICRLVACNRITEELLQGFDTPSVRFFLEGFFYGERMGVSQRLRKLSKEYVLATEPEAMLSNSFLTGPYAPVSRALFESYAPSFSLPGSGVADLIAALGDGIFALVEVKELFARGDTRNQRGSRLQLSSKLSKYPNWKQVQDRAAPIGALEPAFLIVTNVAEWFLYDEEGARDVQPVKTFGLDDLLAIRENGSTLGSYFKDQVSSPGRRT
jgi:hypothetical protein